MRKNPALFLAIALTAAMLVNTAVPVFASDGSDDDPYKLIMVEEPKPSSGTGVFLDQADEDSSGEAQAADTASADTSDPYKGGGNADPY